MAISDQVRPRVFVYCDDPAHGGRVAVTAFCPTSDTADLNRWDEWRATNDRESGLQFVDNAQALPHHDRPDPPHYRVRCDKCGDHTAAVLSQETLFRVLDALVEHNLAHVTLAALAATAAYASTTPGTATPMTTVTDLQAWLR